jgi:hypothetical protein
LKGRNFEAGHTTAPDHMPDRDKENACISGGGPRINFQDGLGTLARIWNEPLCLAQLLRGQAGKQAAKFSRIEAGHGRSPRASEASAYLTGAQEQRANQHALLTPPAALCHGGTDEGAPGDRPVYDDDFYAAYARDPEGNKLCFLFCTEFGTDK